MSSSSLKTAKRRTKAQSRGVAKITEFTAFEQKHVDIVLLSLLEEDGMNPTIERLACSYPGPIIPWTLDFGGRRMYFCLLGKAEPQLHPTWRLLRRTGRSPWPQPPRRLGQLPGGMRTTSGPTWTLRPNVCREGPLSCHWSLKGRAIGPLGLGYIH